MLDIDIHLKLRGFTLEVTGRADCRALGIFGPSGSGKTTLLSCVAGLIQPDRGCISVVGRTVFDRSARPPSVPARRRQVGYVFQDALLFPHMTVEQNLKYGRHPGHKSLDFRRVVEILGVGHLLDRRPLTLSGGEARRVALGRAMLAGPELLLLDEPLTGLDFRGRCQMLALLGRLKNALSLPMIYVSHHPGEIRFLCDRVWVLDKGRKCAEGQPGTLSSLYAAPGDVYEDEIENLFVAARGDGGDQPGMQKFRLGDQWVHVSGSPSTSGGESLLGVRGSDIVLARDQPTKISARNILRGKVTDISQLQDWAMVSVDVGESWVVRVTPSAVSELELEPGIDLWVIVKATSIFAIDCAVEIN
ncbi:MAG: molybdenum ABC transporter ATP-binding protein [Planctomycetota bacterium]